MIQAIGLTSNARKERPPTVDDVSFEAAAGRVTALLGARGAGKTTVVRLMLELQQGRGITYFRGRPLHRITHPAREVGVLLGDVPGHPARTVRGQLRMLCSAAGVPVRRADEVLEVVGLVSLRDLRLGTLSRGMDRRLGLACALLADPHTLVLDGPADGLSGRESKWMHGILRAHAAVGGTVLFTTGDPKEAARTADRVVTLDEGRVVADQEVADFARTRLRPRVAVRSPHAARLGVLLSKEARTAKRSVEVVTEDGSRLSVYGSSCADVGETAYRHGILVHQLADETGDAGLVVALTPLADAGPPPGEPDPTVQAPPAPPLEGADTEARPMLDPVRPTSTFVPLVDTAPPSRGAETASVDERAGGTADSPRTASALPGLPPPITVRPAHSPLRPLRYELRRATGIATGYITMALVLAVSALLSVVLARAGHTPQPRLLAAWPRELPLPPAALGAGLLGAFAFGDEFRHPALAADRGTVPRRLGLLAAKLIVGAATAVIMAALVIGCDAALLHLVYGPELTQVPADSLSLSASWFVLVVACAWAGVLASGVFRSTAAGLAAVLAVPIVIVPLVQKALEGPSVRTAAGLPARLRELALLHWPFGAERIVAAGVRMVAQPVGGALMLSLTALLCAYVLTVLRPRAR
ncbi:ATP-binding cassette domain-containing protein [Streptomyces sp. VRA16 Mangrove soil]|uniref:ATP-binding cassette domain-containing protein n=1 Tax=Streptomyces sp. VRA16 Mangrove soil TaxID=2817434 RepID=UPI001A9F5A3A|nr:ATP-binding cassette domain-containing protein [Streptomyces sp. VRA16 Mangrove soil]MBO1335783.1 ATP-binding cassette domain-containing protein [Streptomyces sp. VRA16 Mangrove soil]